MLLDALDHLRVLVADVDVDLLAGEVEHFTAVAVLQPHAVTGYHSSGIQVALCVPRMEYVCAVQLVSVVPDFRILRKIMPHDVSFPRYFLRSARCRLPWIGSGQQRAVNVIMRVEHFASNSNI